MDFSIDPMDDGVVNEGWVLLVGVGVGLVFGVFGAGGSAFATPVLALLGVPPALAVASPLPAMLPASIVGARRHLRAGSLDLRTARLAIGGGVPGVVVGALLSNAVGGVRLLALSGVMLLIVGGRVLLPDPVGALDRARARRERTRPILAVAFVVGLLTGLLANGGGFLLVPMFVLLLGLTATEAAGTSMVTVGVLTIPALAVHIGLGHVDWPVAIFFALGMVPGSLIGSRLATRLPAPAVRTAFGIMLVTFAVWFLVRMAIA